MRQFDEIYANIDARVNAADAPPAAAKL